MTPETAAFIKRHADDDVRQLALHAKCLDGVDLTFALEQIAGRQTARRKLPAWASIEGIVYPPHLSMEQCSSEQTARYKACLAGQGRLIVDLTGGFGVDFSFMAQGFRKAVYVERQQSLCEIARENFQLLGLSQAEVVCCDASDFLQTMEHADLIYLDPARRDDHGARTYGISDCTPDVLVLRELLLEKADRVIIKLSPMLDWRKAVNDVGEQYVREVHIVSVGNECKELLLLIGQGEGLRLVCVCDNQRLEAHNPHKIHEPLEPHDPHHGLFLYEPNASIMKAGCFDEVSRQFQVGQLAQNSHLFVSADYVNDFPGRTFQIDAVTTMNKRELKEKLQGLTQANIAVRNFPLTVAELRKRLKLNEGGSAYIFATTLASGKRVLILCRKAV